MDTLRKIKIAYETNNTQIIKQVNAIFGEPNPLTGTLLEKYGELGNTPLEEPELFKVLTEGEGVFAFSKALSKKLGLKATEFDVGDFASFVNMCKNKITSYRNEDGTFKSTPLTENAKMPNFDQLETLSEVSQDLQNKATTLINEGGDEAMEQFTAADKKLTDTVFKIAGLSRKGMSEWEKTLVRENMISYTTNALNTMLGRSL